MVAKNDNYEDLLPEKTLLSDWGFKTSENDVYVDDVFSSGDEVFLKLELKLLDQA